MVVGKVGGNKAGCKSDCQRRLPKREGLRLQDAAELQWSVRVDQGDAY